MRYPHLPHHDNSEKPHKRSEMEPPFFLSWREQNLLVTLHGGQERATGRRDIAPLPPTGTRASCARVTRPPWEARDPLVVVPEDTVTLPCRARRMLVRQLALCEWRTTRPGMCATGFQHEIFKHVTKRMLLKDFSNLNKST